MQRRTAFLVFFSTCHFSAVQTTRDAHFNAFSTCTDGRLDRHFDGTTVIDTRFQLLGNGFCYDIGVQFWLTDFRNVDLNVFVGQFLELFADTVYLLTTLADNDTGTGSMDGYSDALERTLNYDARDTSLIDTCIEVIADSFILNNFGCEVFASEPVGFPTSDDPQAIADWISLLTHIMV